MYFYFINLFLFILLSLFNSSRTSGSERRKGRTARQRRELTRWVCVWWVFTSMIGQFGSPIQCLDNTFHLHSTQVSQKWQPEKYENYPSERQRWTPRPVSHTKFVYNQLELICDNLSVFHYQWYGTPDQSSLELKLKPKPKNTIDKFYYSFVSICICTFTLHRQDP